MNERLHLAKNRIDVIAAVLGVCGGLLVLYFYTLKSANAYLLMIGIVFTFTCIVYLLFRDKLVYPAELNIQPNRPLNFVLNIIFVLLFTSSIYVLHTNVFRPPIYFVLISLCASILAVEVLLYNPVKKYLLYLLLFEICLVAFNLRAGIYLNYRGMIGIDPWGLRLFVVDIINNGVVVRSEFLGKYSSFPIMQIYSAIASLICGVSSKLGMFIAVTLPNIFCCIFIFLIARKLCDEKIGLIAMLIYGFCDFSISYSIQICAWSFGIALYIIILYLLIGTKGAINKYQSHFLLLFFGLLILTHPVPTAIMLIPVIILFVYAKLFKSKGAISDTLVASCIVGTLSYWIYASYSTGANVKQNFFNTIVGPLYYSLTTEAAVLHRVETIESTTGAISQLFFESLLNILGFGLVVLFGLVGGLILLSDKRRDILKLSLILITLVLFAFPFAFGFLGIRNIMNYRWFVYGYVTLAILAAIGLTTIIGHSRNINKKIIAVFLMIFVLSFFMTTNTMCNHDSPIYHKDSARRLAFTGQELSLRNELINTYSGPITVDGRYLGAITRDDPYPDPKDIKFYSARYSYEDFCNGILPQSLFIWREDYKDRPRILYSPVKGSMLVVFGENFKEKLESDAYNKIYSNGEVTSYLYTLSTC
jgi:hypothetical protein